MSDLQSLLNQRAEDLKKPDPLPAGHYHGVIDNRVPDFRKANDKDICELRVIPRSAGEDVNQETLMAQGGIGERTLRHSLWLDPESLWRVKELAEKLGVDTAGMNVGQMIQALGGRPCTVKVKHTVAKDGSEIYANIETITAA